jgi:hypothetical protein
MKILGVTKLYFEPSAKLYFEPSAKLCFEPSAKLCLPLLFLQGEFS